MKRAPIFLAAVLCLGAWDTKEKGALKNKWTSMFHEPTFYEYSLLVAGGNVNTSVLIGNEHQEISHWALLSLGWISLYTRPLAVTMDLNESIFRPELRAVAITSGIDKEFHYCDDVMTPLTERCIPHPARFAGIPDFSYAIHDWLNKNQFCPALPPGTEDFDSCYEYGKWLGAVMNASHFGDQAEAHFRHFHGIALGLARNARQLRQDIQNRVDAGEDLDMSEALQFVREAELEALAYEGQAQHFLQDRWSMGHMWNRWNGSSWEALTPGLGLDEHRVIGGLTGIIHGSEAVLSQAVIADLPGSTIPMQLWPDPMCSPVVDDDPYTATPVRYVQYPSAETRPAVGDYRFADMLNESFGASYGYNPAFPLKVPVQLNAMQICSMAAWADVGRGFYDNGDGTVGEHGLPIGASTPTFSDESLDNASDGSQTIPCWSHWATNEAMATGMSHLGQSKLLAIFLKAAATGSLWIEFESALPVDLKPIKPGDLGRLWYAIMAAGRDNPNGTDMAEGLTLPSINGATAGQNYLDKIPAPHHEPADTGSGTPFDRLPEHADTYEAGPNGERPGLDKHTLMGFFNRAHAEYWCDNAEIVFAWDESFTPLDELQGLRQPVPRIQDADAVTQAALDRRLDACVMLADRLYRGTRAMYLPSGQQDITGTAKEMRKVNHGSDGADLIPPCEVFDKLPADLSAWEDNPYDLHPGYVNRVADTWPPETSPYETVEQYDTLYYASIVNWCNSVPVVHTHNDISDDNVAANPTTGEPILVTPGFDSLDRMAFAQPILEPTVTIYGYNFGDEENRVKLVSLNACTDPIATTEFAEIVSWSDTEISFTVTANRFLPDLYQIVIIRDDKDANGSRVRNPGLALLDIRKGVYTDVQNPGGPLDPLETTQPFRAVHPYCTGGSILRHEIWDCTAVSPALIEECGDPFIAAGTELFDSGPFTTQPGPYPEHTWQVTGAGPCTSLSFPSAPCPSVPPASYGLTYRYDRVSETPVTAPAQQWRFTLAWERKDAP